VRKIGIFQSFLLLREIDFETLSTYSMKRKSLSFPIFSEKEKLVKIKNAKTQPKCYNEIMTK